MSDRTTQPGVRLDSRLWKEFRQDVRDRKGVVKGHLKSELESALREYIDASHGGDTNDRLVRIEEKLEELTDAVSESGEKKKDESVSKRTENRLENIEEQIQEESAGQPKVHEEVVELAIREHAGSSDPTIRRYKELLKQDRVLYEHPAMDRMFFIDSEDYVLAVNAARKGGRLDKGEYSEIVDTYGEEWWLAQQEERADGGQPAGFQ